MRSPPPTGSSTASRPKTEVSLVAPADSSNIQSFAVNGVSSGSTKTEVEVATARLDATAAPIPTALLSVTESTKAPFAGTPELAERGTDKSEAGASVTRVIVGAATTPLALEEGAFDENGVTDRTSDALRSEGFARTTVDSLPGVDATKGNSHDGEGRVVVGGKERPEAN
jgi:hypothetical protein